MRVLIVEDNALLAFMIEESLTEAGHEVLGPVPNVQSALKLVGSETPELALVDINLDGDDTGIALARALRGRGIPVFYATGQVEMARAAGAFARGVLSMPFTPELVVRLVDAMDQSADGKNAVTASAFPPEVELFEPVAETKG